MISLILGKTESGKSHLGNTISKKYKRVIFFDSANCFTDGKIISDFSRKNLIKIFNEFADKESFRLIFRPDLYSTNDESAIMLARLTYYGFGVFNKKSKSKERTLFVVDEADKIKANEDNTFQMIADKGRHLNIDTLAICQSSTYLKNCFKVNASSVYFFKSKINDFISKTIEDKSAISKIPTLETYSFIKWKDNGSIELFDKNRNKVSSF